MQIKKRYVVTGILALGIIIPGVIVYSEGYRIGAGFTLVKPGNIVIKSIPENAKVFFDNKNKAFASNEVTLQSISPGEHSLLIASDGYWPWTKPVIVEGGKTIVVHPFLLKQTSTRNEITKQSEFVITRERIRNAKLPSADKKLISESGNVAVYVDNDIITAEWVGAGDVPDYFCNPICLKTFAAFTSVVPLRNVAFLPGREDVILIAAEKGIFALELDGRGVQNFQPLYSGINPLFATDKENIDVYDGTVFILSDYI